MINYIVFIILGLLMLFLGGDWLVRGASRISIRIGISVMVVGLTVVAFGTSAPEFIVSLIASYNKNGDVALGNIIGSNIANIALILGVTALIRPIKIKANSVNKEIIWMLVAVVAFFITAVLGEISRIGGVIFLTLFGTFLYGCFKRKDKSLPESQKNEIKGPVLYDAFFLISGLILLVFGGKVVVKNAVYLAKMLNISELFIGIVIIALGTSLPELITGIIASIKDKQDIAVGNVVGSNIFNILWVLGVCALVWPLKLDVTILKFHMPALILFSVIAVRLVRSGHIITRLEGFFLTCAYFIYISINYIYLVK